MTGLLCCIFQKFIELTKNYITHQIKNKSMPEFVRRATSETCPRVLCPALEEGAILPAGLTDEQRLCLTQGRLAKDFGMGIRIVKNP